MSTLTTCLCFVDQAEDAAKFYTSIFKDSRITSVVHFGEGGPTPAGTVMTTTFEIQDHEFLALNGGDAFHFTEAFSMVVNCDTQDEIDYYWNRLTEGGKEVQCGWLTDKFGVSWQVVPRILGELLQGDDPLKTRRVMEAMLTMIKLDIAGLKHAYYQA